MPDQSNTIPPVPPVTAAEAEAQRLFLVLLDILRTVKVFLGVVHAQLPDPADAEAMGEGTIPESLSFSLRGTVEVVLEDHIRPAIRSLKKAAKETPESLHRDWLRQSRRRKP